MEGSGSGPWRLLWEAFILQSTFVLWRCSRNFRRQWMVWNNTPVGLPEGLRLQLEHAIRVVKFIIHWKFWLRVLTLIEALATVESCTGISLVISNVHCSSLWFWKEGQGMLLQHGASSFYCRLEIYIEGAWATWKGCQPAWDCQWVLWVARQRVGDKPAARPLAHAEKCQPMHVSVSALVGSLLSMCAGESQCTSCDEQLCCY